MKESLLERCLRLGETGLLEQWHPEKNNELTPGGVSFGSHKKVWWRCEKGHEWQAAVYSRAGNAAGCPYCTGRRLQAGCNSLADIEPALAAQWNAGRNGGISPGDVAANAGRRVWWRCERGHEWQATVNSRAQGNGCPVCANQRVNTGENDLAATHPELARQWNGEKNGALTPEQVVAGTRRKVWWRCERGHEWQAAVSNRANGAGCPVCSGHAVLPGYNDLASRYPAIAAQWHPEKNGGLTPREVTAFSNRKVWWRCEKGHEYESKITNRTSASTGCPYCMGVKVLPGFNDLATREPEVAAEWHGGKNGSLQPDEVMPGSGKKVWWQCAEGHEWQAAVYSRTGAAKRGCPVCSRGERARPYRPRAVLNKLPAPTESGVYPALRVEGSAAYAIEADAGNITKINAGR